MRRFSSFVLPSYCLAKWKSVAAAPHHGRLDALEKRVQDIEDVASVNRLLAFYASRPIHRINDLNEVVYHCTKPDYNAEVFCHMELPVLLARLVNSIDALPCGLSAMPSILLVRKTYLESFNKLVQCDLPVNKEKIEKFRKVVEDIEEEHADRNILVTMAKGLVELKELLSSHRKFIYESRHKVLAEASERLVQEGLMQLTPPLDEFALRMIYYNFLSRMLLNLNEARDDERVGMVDLQIELDNVVRNAVDDAKQVCTEHYGDSPDVRFIVCKDDQPMKFAHMSSTISYIVVELMKNAFRATVEGHMERNSSGMVTCTNMPPVEVLITFKENAQHACICISDEGLGMTKTDAELAMTYAFTSVETPVLLNEESNENQFASPLAGYGFGLPMSRVYAMSFGGDLIINTMEGYGTRAYYYIKL